MPTVELVVIARNEEAVIARALKSASGLVDSMLVFVDGETTDNTEGVALALGARVVRGPSLDVLEARNAVLEHVQADYVLTLDADDMLEGEYSRETLLLDSYELPVIDGSWRYTRVGLYKAKAGFRYEGVAHEMLVSPEGATSGFMEKLFYRRIGGGSESVQESKLLKRALKLEAHLEKHPEDARSRFYCGMSFREAKQWRKSVVHLSVRVQTPGWDEETFYAQFELGKAVEFEGGDPSAEYLKAYELRPTRAEPLFELARYYRERSRYALAYLYALRASEMSEPKDRLFVDCEVYRWKALAEAAVAARELKLPNAEALLRECGKRI